MAERIENGIEINDLPPEETLTPEEKERIAAAGRQSFRPTFDALEARELMANNILANVAGVAGPPSVALGERIQINVGTQDYSAIRVEGFELLTHGTKENVIEVGSTNLNLELRVYADGKDTPIVIKPTIDPATGKEVFSLASLGAGKYRAELSGDLAGNAVSWNVVDETGNFAKSFVKHEGSSDASGAVAVTWKDAKGNTQAGKFVVDDKSDLVRLYNENGKVLAEYDLGKLNAREYDSVGNLVRKYKLTGTGTGKEFKADGTGSSSDFEAAVLVKEADGNSSIYIIGSGGAGSNVVVKVNLNPAKDGQPPTLGSVDTKVGFRDAIANSSVGDTTVYTPGGPMKLKDAMNLDKNSYNIEGFVIRQNQDGTMTVYVGFRAPQGKNGEALLLPVTNFQQVMSGQETTWKFGTLVRVPVPGATVTDGHVLYARGIRDIKWSPEAQKFFFLVGNYGVGKNATLSTQLWSWAGEVEDGKATGLSMLTETVKDPEGKWMSWEAISSITKLQDGTWEVELISDDGGSTHGKEDANENINPFSQRYFYGVAVHVSVP